MTVKTKGKAKTSKAAKAKASDAAAIASVFGSATAAKAHMAKSKGKSKMELEMGEGFDTFVALTLVEKALSGVKKQLEGQFKDDAYTAFTQEINDHGKKPDSMVGVAGDASALFVFKKRSAGFNDEVAKKLDAHNVEYDQEEIVPERFTINPELTNDQEKLAKLAKAITKLDLGFDVIQTQTPTYKNQFNDATIAKLAKLNDPNIQNELIKAISSVAVSQAKLGGVDAKGGALDTAMKILKDNGIL